MSAASDGRPSERQRAGAAMGRERSERGRSPRNVVSAPAEVDTSVRAWIAAWGAEVAAVELQQARRRFDPAVVAFGTVAEVVKGIDQLHDDQWANVWPNIADFAFRVDDAEVLASPDGLFAVAVVPWDSTGTDDAGRPYARPGRATIVLGRDAPGADWRGAHTHFSLAPRAR